MTYATLMVHLEIGQSNAGLLQIAGDLAERFHAGVIGVAVGPPPFVPYGEGYVDYALIEQTRRELAHEMTVAEAQFRNTLSPRIGTLHWRSTLDFLPAADYLSREARSADLLITGVSSGEVFDSSRAMNAGALIMQVGRPVLVVPAHRNKLRLERVTVGWKDTRETRRAVSDALPLLKRMSHVTVVEIAPDIELADARRRLDDVVGWLARHGVTAVSNAVPSTGDDAEGLYTLAQDQGADLLVAGAYGHSRLREWALGGVTRDLLLRANCCTLLSH